MKSNMAHISSISGDSLFADSPRCCCSPSQVWQKRVSRAITSDGLWINFAAMAQGVLPIRARTSDFRVSGSPSNESLVYVKISPSTWGKLPDTYCMTMRKSVKFSEHSQSSREENPFIKARSKFWSGCATGKQTRFETRLSSWISCSCAVIFGF